MSVISIAFLGLVGVNALLFVALLLRSSRPHLRSRLFRWTVHTKTARAENKHHLPA